MPIAWIALSAAYSRGVGGRNGNVLTFILERSPQAIDARLPESGNLAIPLSTL
jgi:hypothetical protein